MAAARIGRVWDFARHNVDVAICCFACGLRWAMTAEQLVEAFGRDTTVVEAQARTRCECGHAGAKFEVLPRMRD